MFLTSGNPRLENDGIIRGVGTSIIEIWREKQISVIFIPFFPI